MKCNGKLIKNTGISPGNYKYFASKGACDNFFLGKSFADFSDYSVVRGEAPSKHGYNVQCVHVDMAYSDSLLCDYVGYQNSGDNRWMFGIVTSREYVNEKSTRLYFTIDYVASYYDTIKIGKSFVERTHVNDDWVGGALGELGETLSANKYFLSEPIGSDAYSRPELIASNPFEASNARISPDTAKFNVQSSVSDTGEISKPTINFQSGGAISGYLYTGDQSYVEDIMAKYVTFMTRPIAEYKSVLSYVTSLYYAPEIIASSRDMKPLTFDDGVFLISSYINFNNLPPIKNAKTLGFIKYGVRSANNIMTFEIRETGNVVRYTTVLTGSSGGYAQLKFKNVDGQYMGVDIQTPVWPPIAVSGTEEAKQYHLNIPHERQAAPDGVMDYLFGRFTRK